MLASVLREGELCLSEAGGFASGQGGKGVSRGGVALGFVPSWETREGNTPTSHRAAVTRR